MIPCKKIKRIHYVASYQGACLFLANLSKIKTKIIVFKNFPIFKKFLTKKKLRILKTFPKSHYDEVICWGGYAQDVFLLKSLKYIKKKVEIMSESKLTNKIFKQKELSLFKCIFNIERIKNFFFLKKRGLPCIQKQYRDRNFYCIPDEKIKKFKLFSKKSPLNRGFLSFLKRKYKKQIKKLNKIKKEKVLFLDPKQKIKKNINIQVLIKNHPASKYTINQYGAIFLPKEIPFEYCEHVFQLTKIKKIFCEKNSSLRSLDYPNNGQCRMYSN